MKDIAQKLLLLLFLSLALISCNIGDYNHHHNNDEVLISYDANGADSGSIPSSHGSDQGVQRNIGNLGKNGYIFDGWNSSPDGSGADYTPGSSSPAKSITLYAKWASIFNYTVSHSMCVSSLTMNAAPVAGSYLHITGLTARGRELSDLAITDTIDGFSVTSIRAGAFQGCSNIKKVTVAGSVRSIGDNAFAGCGDLNVIMKGAEPPEMGVGVFASCSAVISVPPGAKDAYSNDAGWNSYSSWIVTYYTVTFKSGDADIDAYPPELQVVYPDKTIRALPADPVRSGYLFGGWYTGPNGTGTLFTANTEVTADLTVYAKWTPVSQDGIRLSFSIISFKDARVPSHLYHNITPDLNATYYYKATPRWTSDLKTVLGATENFVQLPYDYSINTRVIDMGLFAPGYWDFEVRVISADGVTLYVRKVSNCRVNSQRSVVSFVLEKHYEGTGTLRINAVSEAVNNRDIVISYAGPQSGSVRIPMAESQPGTDGTVTFARTLSLSPGFYVVNLTLVEKYGSDIDNKWGAIASKSGYIEVFGNETSVLNGTISADTWMAEGYTDAGMGGGFFLPEKKKLGMIISANGTLYPNAWKFTARQTEDSEEIGNYIWYVNGVRQLMTGPEFILNNVNAHSYLINCFAVDASHSSIVGAELQITVR